MSNISAVSNMSYADYSNIASGKKINNASDGAAELSIIKKENVQTTGLETGAKNMASANDALTIADGALAGIEDYLQRIRELSLGASNFTATDADKTAFQQEIDNLKAGISDIAKGTSYNTNPLLDGTKTDYSLATDANGNKTDFSTVNSTLDELGIKDFDVTGEFSLDDIDKALDKVSSARAGMGAQTNAFDYAINYNKSAAYNTTAAQSRLEDLDVPKAISDLQKKETLQTYALMMQKKKQEEEDKRTNGLLQF